MNKLRVLLLSDEEAKSILWCARSGGHTVHVAGAPARNAMLKHHPFCAQFHELPDNPRFVDLSDELVGPIVDIANSIKADVICPSSFECIQYVTKYRDALSKAAPIVPLTDKQTVTMLDDKNEFFEFCMAHDIAHPASVLIRPDQPIDKVKLEQLTLPVITKPVLGAGEVGIVKFDRWPELYGYLDKLGAEPDSQGPLLIQEWFAGIDIDFNGYAINGEVIAGSVMRTRSVGDKYRVSLTDFVEHEEVSKVGTDIIKFSGYTGPLNIDMRIREYDGRVMAIEVNPRFWDRIVISLIDGMNFVDAGIQLAGGNSQRQNSLCGSKLWPSSVRDLLSAAVIERDGNAVKALFHLTLLQFRFSLTNKLNKIRARKSKHA